MYNIFVDDVRMVIGRELAYEASAIVNNLLDTGHTVSSDLWGDYDPTAMLTPVLHTECRGDLLTLAISPAASSTDASKP